MSADSNKSFKARAMANPSLTRAYEKVMHHWFPVNQLYLDQVLNKLKVRNYSIDDLVIDLRQDPALFTYCLKELCKSDVNKAAGKIEDPVILFRQAGVEKIKSILKEHHGLETYSKDQLDSELLLRVNENEICSETMLVLAEELNLDAGLGQSISFFRQLGLSLVSWNFPEQYRAALKRVKEQCFSLDDAMSIELGFSARLMTEHIIDDWGMSDEIIRSMKTSPLHLDLNQMGNANEIFTRVCEIGENLAQTKNNDFYPKNSHCHERVERDLTKQFGHEKKAAIQDKLNERIQQAVATGIKPRRIPTSIVSRPFGPKAEELFNQNRYLLECPSEIKNQLSETYKEIEPGKLSIGAARALCSDTIPGVGFKEGCLYIFEPERMKLLPRFKVGETSLSKYEPVHCQYDLGSSHIARAFQAGFPSLGQDEEGNSFIVGVVGRSKKAGVLYLKISQELVKYSESDLLVIFKAIVHTLSDCLDV